MDRLNNLFPVVIIGESCHTFLDGYCSTVQGLLDWFEVDLGFTELLFIQIDLCVIIGESCHIH